MAVGFNLPNGAFRQTAEEAGGQPNYMNALLQGLQGSQQAAKTVNTPRQLSEDYLKTVLGNKHQEIINKYAPRSEEARIGATESNTGLDSLRGKLMQAQVDKMNRPEALSGETAQLFALRNTLPPGTDRDKVDQIIARKAEGSAGTQLSVDPTTGAVTFSQGGSRGGAGSSMQTFDANGNPQIVHAPTQASSTSAQLTGSAQAGRKAVEPEAIMPYVGVGAGLKLSSDYLAAKNGDQGAKERLIDAAATNMLVHDMALNQLRATDTRVTDKSTKLQMDAIKKGWSPATDTILSNLPPEEQAAAHERYKLMLDKMNEAKQQYGAQGYPIKLRQGLNDRTPEKAKKEQAKIGVPKGKMRVYFPDGPHVIPESLWEKAQKAGATLEPGRK